MRKGQEGQKTSVQEESCASVCKKLTLFLFLSSDCLQREGVQEANLPMDLFAPTFERFADQMARCDCCLVSSESAFCVDCILSSSPLHLRSLFLAAVLFSAMHSFFVL